MKRLMGPALLMAMLLGVSALAAPPDFSNRKFAQNQEERQGRGRSGPEAGGRGGEQAPNRAPQEQARPNGGQAGRGGGPALGQGGSPPAPKGNNNRAQLQRQGGGGPPVGQPASGGARQGNNQRRGQVAQGRGTVGPVEHGPAQFEKRAFQRNETAPRRFRVGAFRPPVGWQYRRWTYGQYLPAAYWAQPYWVASFWLYGLDRPPIGCEWVRSGPDALLVDVSTGEILEAEYNVFY